MTLRLHRKRLVGFWMVALMSASAGVRAADAYLVASPFTLSLPPDAGVPMWGFAAATAGFASVSAPTVPGPALTVPPGDSSLTVYVRNDLPVPVSLVIPGQRGTSPVHAFTDSQGRSRIDSFATPTAPGAVGTYVFSELRAGTYLYHSGTHVSVQVPMGLYGLMVHDTAAGTAYPGVTYANQALVVLSEIDPRLHQAVAQGTFGTSTYPSTMSFRPKYFLINGAPHPTGAPVLEHALTVGEPTLFRLANAGLETHVPTFLGLYVETVAEDGYPAPYRKEQYSVPLAAGKTVDALLVPLAAGSAALFDSRLFLMNTDAAPGGMLARLTIGGAAGAPTAGPDAYAVAEDAALSVPEPGVLLNDTGMSLTAELVTGPHGGTLALSPTGLFTYTPAPNFAGSDDFTYRVRSGAVPGNVATVRLTVTPVNDAPAAASDSAAVTSGQSVTLRVLANDSDVDGDALAVSAFTQPAHGAVTLGADQSLVYASTAGYSGADAFGYTASDGTGSASAAVAITVNPRINAAPLAANDTASTIRNTPVTVDVAVNDTDSDGALVHASVVILSGPTRGGTVVNHLDGTVTYTPRRNFRGTDTFRYAISDNDGARSNAALVSVNVTR
jgi:FtsP/CotA-like multicopper oxidase with cupredoxin domain